MIKICPPRAGHRKGVVEKVNSALYRFSIAWSLRRRIATRKLPSPGLSQERCKWLYRPDGQEES